MHSDGAAAAGPVLGCASKIPAICDCPCAASCSAPHCLWRLAHLHTMPPPATHTHTRPTTAAALRCAAPAPSRPIQAAQGRRGPAQGAEPHPGQGAQEDVVQPGLQDVAARGRAGHGVELPTSAPVGLGWLGAGDSRAVTHTRSWFDNLERCRRACQAVSAMTHGCASHAQRGLAKQCLVACLSNSAVLHCSAWPDTSCWHVNSLTRALHVCRGHV